MAAAAAVAGHFVDVREIDELRSPHESLHPPHRRGRAVRCANVDTDQIIPKQFLKRVEREGLGPRPVLRLALRPRRATVATDFVLNRREPGARPDRRRELRLRLVSREHAPWALMDFGFRGDRPQLRRHLLQQLLPERPAADRCCRKTVGEQLH